MAAPLIRATGSTTPANSPGVSKLYVAGETLTFVDTANPGATTHLWELVDVPPGQTSTLSSTTVASPTLLLDGGVVGTYRIRYTANGTEVGELLLAIATGGSAAIRIPGYLEQDDTRAALVSTTEGTWNEGGNVKGWFPAVHAAWKLLAESMDIVDNNPFVLSSGSPTVTASANSGLVNVEGIGSGGTEEISLTSSGLVSGVVDADSGATARVQQTGVGGFAFGSSYARSAGTSQITSSGDGSFAFGVANGSNITASAAGSVALGSSVGGDILASGAGASAGGSTTGTGTIEAQGPGTFAHGHTSNIGSLQVTSNYSWGTAVLGWARDGDITAAAAGTLVHGFTGAATGDISAGGFANGSFVGGIVSGSGTASITCDESGAICHGAVIGYGTGVAELLVDRHSQGSIVSAFVKSSTADTAKAATYSKGCSVFGYAIDGDMLATGHGSHIFGHARGANITTNGVGALAGGYANGGDIDATSNGAFAHGNAGGGDLLAAGTGSHASGSTAGLGTASVYAYEKSFVHGNAIADIAGGVADVGVTDGSTPYTTWHYGSTVFGTARARTATSTARVVAEGFNNNPLYAAYGGLVVGYANGQGTAGLAEVRGRSGSFAFGMAASYDTSGTAAVRSDKRGSFAMGSTSTFGGGGDATINANDEGTFAFGYLRSVSTYTATLSASNPGAHASGYCYSGGSADANLLSSGYGSHASGYVGNADVLSGGNGSFAHGFSRLGGTLQASGKGSHASGYTLRGDVLSTANGTFSHGMVNQASGATGSINSSDLGAFASGYAKATGTDNADILSSGKGSVAFGYALDSDINATGDGSFAHGYALAGDLTATGDGSIVHGQTSGTGTSYMTATSIGSTVLGAVNTANATATAKVETQHVSGRGSIAMGGAESYNAGATASVHTSGSSFGFAVGKAVANGNDATVNVRAGQVGFAMGEAAGGGNNTTEVYGGARGFAFGIAGSGSTGDAIVEATSLGAFASGSAYSQTSSASKIQATYVGARAHGTVSYGGTILANKGGAVAMGSATYGGGTIRAIGTGSFAMGYSYGAGFIEATVQGAFAMGRTYNGYDVRASGSGSFAIGHAYTGDIVASASNSVQFGEGTNTTADSIQVGSGFLAKADGSFGSASSSLTLGAAATTFAVTSSFMTITGDGGTNTLATITGGFDGQRLVLLFVDGNVTITDDNSHAANSVDLSAAFTSADDTTLEIIFDGTSWYEINRSVN